MSLKQIHPGLFAWTGHKKSKGNKVDCQTRLEASKNPELLKSGFASKLQRPEFDKERIGSIGDDD